MLEPRYDHRKTEEKIYKLWEKSGYFNPDNLPITKSSKLKAKNFCIIMPPPNANGSLHLGHAVFVTLQDILIRFWRMAGRKTLWLPGADHAGFETQVVFDKKLEKEGRNRFEIDRGVLFQEIWDFTQKNKKIMEDQLRKLGASCDWSREKFTLDPDIVKIVYETFERLYRDGLIYRGERLVNWCTKHQTSLSELEVVYQEQKDPLYYIKYGLVVLATVRLETKFGDTAVAVNPKDKRYKELIGKEIEIETIIGRAKIKVIADAAVDPKFGTGAIKVTPAHDPTDFEIWQRHKKEIPGPKEVINKFGRLDIKRHFPDNKKAGRYEGLKISEARKLLAEDMQKAGLLVKTDNDYKHNVATCYKCGTIIEPRLMPQWFVKTKPLAEKAIKVVEQKKIKFYPERIKKVYFHWLKNIRDWNISRQIVWGIRIPAWFCLGCGEPKINPKIKSKWFIVRHGETDWNKSGRYYYDDADPPLNDVGIMQAEKTAEQLAKNKIDLVISSDLLRARQTAEIIAKKTGADLAYDEKLREIKRGESGGMLVSEVKEKYGNPYTYESPIPGAEGYKDVEERAWKTLTAHRKNHHHRNVVIVTHGGVMRILKKCLHNLSVEEMFSFPSSANAESIDLDIAENPCEKCEGDFYEQDPDVFDTWFSSGQWPFATLMTTRPKEKDFKEFYPTDVMETGYDILFFWVARMIMLGLYRTGKIPFKNVYLHGLVRDKDRQKMSKSKGNVIDPLGVAEIYGADALRMALVVGNTAGNDIVISEEKIRGYRNFATKIWNISRFILMNKSGQKVNGKWQMDAIDKKHLKELEKIKSQITKHIEKFEFHLAAEKLYHYVWHTFADKIIEESKSRLKSQSENESRAAYQTLETILLECLKMLHPFMPFITEEIYQKFLPAEAKASAKAGRPKEILMAGKW